MVPATIAAASAAAMATLTFLLAEAKFNSLIVYVKKMEDLFMFVCQNYFLHPILF